MAQLDFFEHYDELTLMRRELVETRKRATQVSKTLSKRHNELARLYVCLREDYDTIKRRLEALEKSVLSREAALEEETMLERLFAEAYLAEAIL